VVAVANPISPTDHGVYVVDGTGELEDAYRVWERCAKDQPDRSFVPVRDESDEMENTNHFVLKDRGRVVAAGRMHREGQNVRLSRVAVVPGERGKGFGRRLVQGMLSLAIGIEGVVYVRAYRWELGFYSLLGFDCQGGETYESAPPSRGPRGQRRSVRHFSGMDDLMDDESAGIPVRVMIYHPPGVEQTVLHHVCLRTRDIERALGFYGAIGFTLQERFRSLGKRACKLDGYGTSIQLVEDASKEVLDSKVVGGVSGIAFDVTKACTDLPGYIEHLERKNGGFIQMVTPPTESVIGRTVRVSAVIVDPDGFPLEFIRREALLPGELTSDNKW